MANIRIELPAKGIIQNNFVRVLTISSEDLSGTGSLKSQLCEYILSLDIKYRTIMDTDSKWNVVLGGYVYEIINKGKGTITSIIPDNLLLMNETSSSNEKSEVLSGEVNGINRTFTTSQPYVQGSIKIFLNGIKEVFFQEFSNNTILFEEAPRNTGFVDRVEGNYLTN